MILLESRFIKDDLFIKDFTNPIDLVRLNPVAIDEAIKVNLPSHEWDFLKQNNQASLEILLKVLTKSQFEM